jgi:hypothetical protein
MRAWAEAGRIVRFDTQPLPEKGAFKGVEVGVHAASSARGARGVGCARGVGEYVRAARYLACRARARGLIIMPLRVMRDE